MKKIIGISLILSSILFSQDINENTLELKNIELKEKLTNTKASKFNIINDINFKYDIGKSYLDNSSEVNTQNFSISFNQDIFRSGGILYYLQYNDMVDKISNLEYNISINNIILNIVNIKYNYEIQKLQLNNNLLNKEYLEIEKIISEEEYQAGIGSFLNINNKIISLNNNIIQNNSIKNEIQKSINDFNKYSSVSLDKYNIPIIKEISLNEYLNSNEYELLTKQIELADKALDLQKSSYLPKISINSSYSNNLETEQENTNIGLSVSIPLKLTKNFDIESKKINVLKSKLNLKEQQRLETIKYKEIVDNIENYNNNIDLYKKIYKNWKENYEIKKTEKDASIISNKQLELFKIQVEIAQNNINIEELKKHQYISSVFIEFQK